MRRLEAEQAASDMVKGLKRIFGDQPREVRRGIAPQALRKAFDLMLNLAISTYAN